LWHVSLRWQRNINAALAPLGLTHVQFILLGCTWWLNQQGTVPNQLAVASFAGADPKMASEVLRKLESSGLVKRSPDGNDGRAKVLEVTGEGAELLSKAIPVVEKADASLFGDSASALTPLLRELAGVESWPRESATTVNGPSAKRDVLSKRPELRLLCERQCDMSVRTKAPYDAIVIGAGYSGMYALYRLREMGLRVRAYDAAGGVGGTWWWNRYPGARVDFLGGPLYCYTFSEDLAREWDWQETQPSQPEVLAYLNFVADRLKLRPDIQLNTRVESMTFDEATSGWDVSTSAGDSVQAQFVVCGVGALSAAAAFRPEIAGIDDFAGELYHTGHWPQDTPVVFHGKRVGVIGTGSSGVQSVPAIAEEALDLTVFQRTPQFAVPARNRPLDPEVARKYRETWPDVRRQMLESAAGAPLAFGSAPQKSALDDTPEERQRVYETAWQAGGAALLFCYNDILVNPESNQTLAEFVRRKIREVVADPAVAAKLMPGYYIGTKRFILDSGYFETFNRGNVHLVDLREDPIERVLPGGVRTSSGEHPLDMLVLATGYDAMTGALRTINPVGRRGIALTDKWADGAHTYLGVAVAGFPNLFMIQGPESPSVLYNMPLGAERQGDWVTETIRYARASGVKAIEATLDAEKAWGLQVAEIANYTLYPKTDSWYVGANIPGKPRKFSVHLDSVKYYQTLSEVADNGYEGFATSRVLHLA
jgi:cation diffusion facilitator CzcD-associated flavoprotein CzcO/DNA-binding MarR family transcriptional regulator